MITLEALKPEHFELAAAWLSNKQINQWLTAEWRGRTITASILAMAVRNRRNRIFVVHYRGQACGLACLADIDMLDKTAMVWYLLGEPSLAGQGVTSEAVKQLTRLAFREMALESVYAWTMDGNIPSQRVLQKAGFAQAGRIRRATHSNEQQVDRIFFDLLPGDIRS
jgi:RimJ/RimL family protein N-acetyltransferase